VSERPESGRPESDLAVTLADVEAARERLAGVVHRTPLDTSRTFAELSGAASSGTQAGERPADGVVQDPRGVQRDAAALPGTTGPRRRHGQRRQPCPGRRACGDLLGVDVTVVVPEITPAAKIAATRGYGAEVVVEGDIYERSYEYARERAAETGETFVHPFDNRAVIAGQGTVGLELLDQYPELDAVPSLSAAVG